MFRLPSPKHLLRPLLALLLAAAPLAAYAADPPGPGLALASDDPIVATVNGDTIHKSDVERIAKGLGAQQGQPLQLDKVYPQILSRLVDFDLLAQAARADKLQDTPAVKADLAWNANQVLAQAYLRQVGEKALTDDALHAAYQKTVNSHTGEEEIHARHILVASEADAKAIIAQLDKGADFAKLANEKSQDKAGDGGDLGWFTKDKMVPAFSDAAFKLKKGEYTKAPIKTQFGWHVIKVEDRRTAKPPTFDEVKDQLRQQIGGEAVGDTVKKLKDSAKVQEFNLDGSPMVEAPATPAPAAAPATPPAPKP